MKPIVYLFFLVIVFDTYGFPAKPGPFHKSKSMGVPSKKQKQESPLQRTRKALKDESNFDLPERKGEGRFNEMLARRKKVH